MYLKNFHECDVLLIIWSIKDYCNKSILYMRRLFKVVEQEAEAGKLYSL